MDNNLSQTQGQRLEINYWQLLKQCPDPAMNRVKYYVKKMAEVETPVVIFGETGTGKEIVAGAIHQLSVRGEREFKILDCTNLNPNLAGSELFGHKRGSFTGADQSHIGQLEAANESSLFFDEIGELPLDLQPKFLRSLETGKFCPVGSTTQVYSDFRMIAATNRDLEAMVKDKKFREDLLYRMKVISIDVPPLRKRPLDIICLAKFFVQNAADGDGKKISFAPESEEWLRRQNWPGNIRELRNVMERAKILVNGDGKILPGHLDGSIAENPEEFARVCAADPEPNIKQADGENPAVERLVHNVAKLTNQMTLRQLQDRVEMAAIIWRLGMDGSPGKAAEKLGLSTQTLREKRHKHGLPIS